MKERPAGLLRQKIEILTWYQFRLSIRSLSTAMTTSVPSTSDIAVAVVPPPSATVFASPLPHNPVRLDRSNFLLWKTLTLPNLSCLNLHGYLNGTTVAPAKTITDGALAHEVPNPAYLVWWQQDQRVLGALLSSMTEDVATQMVGLKTAAEVWSTVHHMFSAQNRASIRHTRLQLQTLKKQDMSAAAYFQKMKSLADTMATIGSPLMDG